MDINTARNIVVVFIISSNCITIGIAVTIIGNSGYGNINKIDNIIISNKQRHHHHQQHHHHLQHFRRHCCQHEMQPQSLAEEEVARATFVVDFVVDFARATFVVDFVVDFARATFVVVDFVVDFARAMFVVVDFVVDFARATFVVVDFVVDFARAMLLSPRTWERLRRFWLSQCNVRLLGCALLVGTAPKCRLQ
ncbi:unnamed protein product [Lampetra planeri]